MADMSFEEHCPCGASIKMSGYESRVTPHVETWHKTHDKHSNTIAKAIAENNKTTAQNMGTTVDGTKAQS